MEIIVFAGAVVPPLFAAIWILWCVGGYCFRTPGSEKTSCKTVFYSLYAGISICIVLSCVNIPLFLIALFASNGTALFFNWGMLLLCALLKGIEVLIEDRSGKRKQ